MINQLAHWQGACEINGQHFDSFPVDFSNFKDTVHIKLYPKTKSAEKSTETTNKVVTEGIDTTSEYKITVKQYMTRKATPEFDFMAKFNNDNPMPLRTMIGTVEKETKGMVYMKLHAQAEPEIRCMRCGRELTNPVSRIYGIGPECIHKIPVFFDIDIEDVDAIKERMVNVIWEGWIIRSSILKAKRNYK